MNTAITVTAAQLIAAATLAISVGLAFGVALGIHLYARRGRNP